MIKITLNPVKKGETEIKLNFIENSKIDSNLIDEETNDILQQVNSVKVVIK